MPAEFRQIYPNRTFEFGDSESSLAVTHTAAGPALDVQTSRDNASNQVAVFRGGNRSTPADGDRGDWKSTPPIVGDSSR